MPIKIKLTRNIKKYFKKIKNYFYILKYFFIEELLLVLVIILSFSLISFYVFTNDLQEIIPFGSELAIAGYDISIAFLTGVILYFFINFLPKINKRKNAQRELNFIINNLTKLISIIIENYYSNQKLREINFYNNSSKYIYGNINEISQYIADTLKLEDVLKFAWNKDKKITFLDEFFKTVNKFNADYEKIILKYGDYLENKTLDNLEEIYRNYIFINIRDHNCLSHDDICSIGIEKLLQNMRDIQETANKINNICK